MKEYLAALPQEIMSLIALAEKVSRQTGMPAYLVGGFPRDLILGLENWDLDITVDGDGIGFAEVLSRKLNSRLVRHERFGTASLVSGCRLKIDVATIRKETYPFDASLPVVRKGSLKDDLFRRDFTINAMAIDLSAGGGRRLIDMFGGRDDLLARKIRIMHDRSFKDDPTRILRAIRFQRRYGFRIEGRTLRLLKEAVGLGMLEKVHPHRMRDELALMFKEKDPAGQLSRLNCLCGLSFLSRRLRVSQETYRLFRSVGRELYRFMREYPFHGEFDSWVIYLAAILNLLEPSCEKQVIRKLGLSGKQEKNILACRRINRRLITTLKDKRVKPAKVFKLLKPLSYEAVILLLSVSRDSRLRKNVSDFLGVYNSLQLCISGEDLCRLGVLPGPKYQEVLDKVFAARLNGKVKNRQEEFALASRILKTTRKGSIHYA